MSDAMVMSDVRRPAAHGPQYGLPAAAVAAREPADSTYLAPRPKPPAWSDRSRQLFDFMEIPVEYRDAVPYRSEFLDRYEPNVSSLLPASLAHALHRAARWEDGPCRFEGALTVMLDFMADFCWSSAKLEGCRLSRAESDPLVMTGHRLPAVDASHDTDVRLLLNHRRALEALSSGSCRHPIGLPLILDVHAESMTDLLPPDRCGRMREVDIYIKGTAYQPSNDRALLADKLGLIAAKAAAIRNPVEASFFLWLQIAYLQAFADGNKRTSRLCANAPLNLGRCAPISFSGLSAREYNIAMLGVYERNDVSVAVDVFEWLYRRSMQNFPWLMAEAGSRIHPETLRRHHLGRVADQESGPPNACVVAREPADSTYLAPRPKPPAWSEASRRLFGDLRRDRSSLPKAPYHRDFVDRYIPNESSLLPRALARELYAAAFWREALPYGIRGARMMEEFLVDLSWSSARLEGNSYSREATVQLLDARDSRATALMPEDKDALMLLNHRAAIDLLIRTARPAGLTRRLIEQIHGALMWQLLPDPADEGRIRRRPVQVGTCAYAPSSIPAVLQEMLEHIAAKASVTRNPVEAAFFLWVNLTYLQGFADGNRRTSRLSANVPLLLGNCAPLTFVGVDLSDYTDAMVGIYERRDLAIAADLFEWMYRQSMRRYLAMLDTEPMPDPRVLRFYHPLGAAMRAVVVDRKSAAAAVAERRLPADDAPVFAELLQEQIAGLHENNGGAFRISHEQVMSWQASGRPH